MAQCTVWDTLTSSLVQQGYPLWHNWLDWSMSVVCNCIACWFDLVDSTADFSGAADLQWSSLYTFVQLNALDVDFLVYWPWVICQYRTRSHTNHLATLLDWVPFCWASMFAVPCFKWAASWQNWQNDCAPYEDSDQPGHLPSLIRVFAVCSVDS